MLTIVVIAKECIPGKVKTRLHPPLTLEQAAEIAAASLADTLRLVRSLPADRRIVFYAGTTPPPDSDDFEFIAQGDGALDVRLGTIFDAIEGPMMLIGMDTPHLRRSDFLPVLSEWPADVDAWYGPASDGGWWGLAMREPTGAVLRGVPMSRDDTGTLQLASLAAAGLRVGFLPELNDIDTIDDAVDVAGIAPQTEFARTFARLGVDSPTLVAGH